MNESTMSVQFVATPASQLNSLSVSNGQIIAVTDSDGLYYDMKGSRHSSGGPVTSVDGQTGTVETHRFSETVTATTGDTSVMISDTGITPSSLVEPFCDSSTPIAWSNIAVNTGNVVITFTNALTASASFRVRITNTFYAPDVVDVVELAVE